MSLASYQAAPPRDSVLIASEAGEPVSTPSLNCQVLSRTRSFRVRG